MRSAASIMHLACGSPVVAEATDIAVTACWHCGGETTRGVRVADWMGASFTGQNRIRAPQSEYVCEACIWVMSRASAVPGRPAQPGQACGPNFRNYSHMLDERGYVNASKGEKPAIREWLRAPKSGAWFAAIADSGQKHVVPYAPINTSPVGGRVQFEEDVCALPRDDSGWGIIDVTSDLLTAGATKESVTSGGYTPGEWQRCGPLIRTYEQRVASLRGSVWFRLVVWLAQRDEGAVATRMAAEAEARKAAKAKPARRESMKEVDDDAENRRDNEGVTKDADGGSAAGPESGVSGSRGLALETLGSATRPNASGDAHDLERRGVAHRSEPQSAALGAGQLGLFDAGPTRARRRR